MCEDIEESRLHASEGEQQDLDLEPDTGENKEIVKPARYIKDSRLRDRHCP